MSAPTTDLETRAEELRRIVSAPSEKEQAAAELAAVERQLAEQRDAALREAVNARLLGIRRAYGGLESAFGQDSERYRKALEALREATKTLNARAEQLQHLHEEADALVDRFAIPRVALPGVPEPEAIVDTTVVQPWRYRIRYPKVEQCEHQLRTRRTYSEIANTPGHALIMDAGLKPWGELTERQKEGLAEREKQARDLAKAVQPALDVVRALPPGQSGNVARG